MTPETRRGIALITIGATIGIIGLALWALILL